MVNPYGILGDGPQADETEEFARPQRAEFRAVSSQYLRPGRDRLIDITSPDDAEALLPVVAAVGAPGLRRALVESWPGTRYRTVIAATAWVSETAVIGRGVTIAPQCAVSARAVIGDHVILNLGSTVSHDTRLGDFVTVSPGVTIAGNCTVGAGAFLGVGSTVSNGITIAEGTVVGAGAVVVADIPVAGVYAGVPARLMREQREWLRAI
jgi:sugar O-acyltransferase (sialic acid O-acetyltransferase NeuD family)